MVSCFSFLLLEPQIHRLTEKRFFWVKSLKNSTIISCILSVKKIALKSFDYSVEKREKDERLKALKCRLFHTEEETAVSDLWLGSFLFASHSQAGP